MLSVSALRAGYGQSEVLHGLDFSVSAGEIVAVMGRNGMGKSTLMKTLIGVLPIGGGEIVLDEVSLNDHKTHQRVARGLAYVPQGRMIFPAMTVVENIETGLVVRGGRGRSARYLPAIPGPRGNAWAARRQSVRWAAAATRDCPGARDQSEDAASRRADGGNTTFDHSRPSAHPQADS